MREVNGLSRFEEQRGAPTVAEYDGIADVPSDSGVKVVDMPRKTVSIDPDELARRYLAGESTPTLAAAFGCSIATIARLLTRHDVRLRSIRAAAALAKGVVLDVDDLSSRYLAGESVKSLAATTGVSRPTIKRRLVAAGIPLRQRSDASRTRMQRMTVADRRRLTAAANAATRTGTVSMQQRDPIRERPTLSTAETRTRSVGKGESELLDLLVARGVTTETQVPVYGYNVDIAIGSIAVEVWWGCSYPLRPLRLARRTIQLADLGWSTIFIWLSGQLPTPTGADAVVAFVEETSRRPPSVRPQYRVIRGDGELVSTGEAKLDHLALIPTSSDGTYRAEPDGNITT